MKRKNVLKTLCFAFLIVAQMRPAYSGLVPGVSTNSVYSEFTSGSADSRRAINLVNGNGLFGDVHTATASGAMWLTLATTTGNFTNAFVTFDLGSVQNIDRLKVWNYNEAGALTQRGIQRADILTSSDGVSFTTNFANVAFDRAPGAFTNFGQVISLAGTQARYIRFNVLTNHYVSGAAENRVGLSEVQFFDTNLPPRITLATRNYSSNKVTIVFSESVTLSSATNIANYSIQTDGTNSASISSAAMEIYNNRIVLNTTTLSNSAYTLVVSNVVSAVDGSIITNAQVSIAPEVMLWLKADAGVTTNETGFVTGWSDQSGNGNNAAQAAPEFQPQLVANAINGQPVVHFTGSAGFTNYMLMPHSPSMLIPGGDVSIFAVMKFQTFNSFNTIISKVHTNTQPAPIDGFVLASGTVRFLRGSGWGNNTLNGLSNIVTTQPYVLSFVTRGTNGTQYLNGAFNGSVATVAALGDVASPVAIGGRTPTVGDFGTRLDGDIAEIMVVRGGVSDSDRSAIHDYLGGKYGVPIINLVFNQHPTNITKLEGQTATFRVSVTASTPNISYQWQRFGTNIPNATNASYTTPYLTIANDNNSTFRVLVSVPNSSQFSDTATLTVLQDLEKPTIISAGRRIWSPSEIVVVFSERVQAATATASGNYTLDNGGSVTSASYGETTDKIVLTTTGLTNGGAYLLSVQNIDDLYTNTIVAVQVPVGIYPVAALWLKADTGVTADGSGLVSQWDDQSGNANNAVPFGLSDTYPLLTNGFNNAPVLHFGINGTTLTTNYLACNPSESLALTGDMSIYAVASFVDYATHRTILSKTTVNQPAPYDFFMNSGTGQPRFVRGNGTVSSGIIGTTAPSVGVPHLIYATSKDNLVTHYTDGNINGTGTVTQPVADAGGNLYIGHRFTDAVTTMKGDIAEIIMFGSSLTDGDRANMDLYFSTKYDLVIGTVPRISIAPTNGNAFVLSWPVPTLNFILESATNLTGATWANVTNSVATSSGTNSVTVNASGDQQFYRLHKQ